MNLGGIEACLIAALRDRLPGKPAIQQGPAFDGPATGVRPEVFVHTARFDDLGGFTADGAAVARHEWRSANGNIGFAEDRPARIDVEVTFVAAQLWQAQTLAGLAAMPMLHALEVLDNFALIAAGDATRSLRFTDHRAATHACRSERHVHDGVVVHHVVSTLRLEGFLQVRLAAPGGMHRESPNAAMVPAIEVCFDPEGTDLQREHVLLRNVAATPIDLAGWTIEDAARRPHRYRFASLALIPPAGELRLWSGRGSDDASNLHWGRRQAVWNNNGDCAILRDPDGVERARVECAPAKRLRPSRKR